MAYRPRKSAAVSTMAALGAVALTLASVGLAQTPPATTPPAPTPPTPAPPLATITATMVELRSDRGEIAASLFSSREGWPQNGHAIARCRARPQNRRATCRFEVAPGTYAIGLMHDEDGDRVFDRNFLGMPEEGFGFSNNPGVGLSGPSWESAAFELPAAGTSLSIRVRYGL